MQGALQLMQVEQTFEHFQRIRLTKVLDFKGKHICQSAPSRLSRAALVPSENRTSYEIELDFTVEISAEPGRNTRRMLIRFDNVRDFVWDPHVFPFLKES